MHAGRHAIHKKTPKTKALKAGWDSCETSFKRSVFLTLGLIAVVIILIPIFWVPLFNFLAPTLVSWGLSPYIPAGFDKINSKREIVFSILLGPFAAVLLHELVHIFALPTKQRLRRTLVGFSRVGDYSVAVPWVTVRGRQKRTHFLITALAPLLVISLIALPLAIYLTGSISFFLFVISASNIVGSGNDLRVAIDVLAKTKRDSAIVDTAEGFQYEK